MLSAAAAAPMLSDSTVNTALTVLGSIIIAFFGYLGIKAGVSRSKRHRLEQPEDDRADLDRWEMDPNQFVKDMLEERRQYTEEVKGYRTESGELRREVSGLRSEIAALKREDRVFRTALARWVSRIMDAWGKDAEMPYPEGADANILADVIPSALEATRPQIP